MPKPLDIIFLHPNASQNIYQDLSLNYSAIEPPIWAALLAKHCWTKGFNVELMDCEALHMTDDDASYHIKNMAPRILAFVVYGQQPSASSQNMDGALRLAEKIKQQYPEIKILFVGGHISALPRETLEKYSFIDFVCQNEGVFTISNLLRVTNLNDNNQLANVTGLGFRFEVDNIKGINLNLQSSNVSQEQLQTELPGMMWDLLPMKHYRTALWHSLSNGAERQPFAALYTSLGCPFSCSFCCINAPFGKSSFKYWNPEFIINEFDYLAKLGIKNIKIADEMFVMNPNHFMKLCDLIIERGYKFNIWAYARVDITKQEYLETLKKAGVNWLALGIESSNRRVRKDVYKGRFENTDIEGVVNRIREQGINVMGNYIFGLPEDDVESMQETLDLAIHMNTEGANFYSAMAYPGSALYKQAIEQGWKLPENHSGFSQHSYDCQPLPTKYIGADVVLKFRDEAWQKYHTGDRYLDMIKNKFGQRAYDETVSSAKIKLKRKLLNPIVV